MSHQNKTIGDNVYFWFAANDTSGSGGQGATPIFSVRKAGDGPAVAPLLTGVPVALTNAGYPAGAHEITVAATVINGFAANDTFSVFCSLAIDGQNPTGFVGSCTLTPVASLLADLTQDDGLGNPQFTAIALEQAPFAPSGLPQIDFRWDASVVESDPGQGDVKADNADISLITEIYVNSISDTGGDVDVYFQALQAGDTVSLNKVGNPSSRVVVRILGTVDNTGWWTLQCGVIDSNNTFGNNDSLTMVLSYQANSAAGIAAAVQEEPMAGHNTPGTLGEQNNANRIVIAGQQRGTEALVEGLATAGTLTTTQMSTDLTETVADQYVPRSIQWTGGILDGVAREITGYNPAGGVISYAPTPNVPADGDPFVIA